MLNVLSTIAVYGKFDTKSSQCKAIQANRKKNESTVYYGWLAKMIRGKKFKTRFFFFFLNSKFFGSVFQLASLSSLSRPLLPCLTLSKQHKKRNNFKNLLAYQIFKKPNHSITILSHMPND